MATSKKEMFATILDVINYAYSNGYSNEVSEEDLDAFVNHEVKILNDKAAAAKERAAKKREEGDELRDRIYNTLTEEFMPIDAIVDAINDPNVTRNMVVSRLGQLAELGQVTKDTVTVAVNGAAKNRKVAAYRKA